VPFLFRRKIKMANLAEYRKRPHHSFSALNQFVNNCSLQYAFRYVYKIEPEHTPVTLAFGKAFHAAVEWIARQRQSGDKADSSEVQDLFSDCWNLECLSDDKIALGSKDEWDSLNETGRKAVECLNDNWSNDEKVLHVSHAFCVPIVDADGNTVSEKPLIGEWDCVVRDRLNEVCIVDWKTSARKWPTDKAHKDLQATCFTYAHQSQYGKNPLFRFDVVTKAKTPTYEQHSTIRTKDDFHRLARMVSVVEKAVEAEIFLPNETGFFCDGCQYKGACREWHRAKAKTISFAKAA
jgi:putative RecB family exonuclease